MIEKHVFGEFVPKNAKYLILGSFPVKQSVKGPNYDASYNFFYSIPRNQFWPILETIYKVELKTKKAKMKFLSKLSCAMADIILKCERTSGSNLDANLTNFQYNLKAIKKILNTHPIKKIYFTSRFVEKRFKQFFKDIIKVYPNVKLITLPSPSPRYVLISKKEKIKQYRKLLPKTVLYNKKW